MSCRPRKLEIQLDGLDLRGSWFLHDECPLGKLEKPSSSMDLSFCLQMVEDTKRIPFATSLPNPPKAWLVCSARSGSHRLKRSGRGLPYRFFIPSVKKKVEASDRARPSQPVFHSQSLLLTMAALGVPLRTVGPGTKRSDTAHMITAGATKPTTAKTAEDTFSFSTYGKEMSGSVSEKGR